MIQAMHVVEPLLQQQLLQDCNLAKNIARVQKEWKDIGDIQGKIMDLLLVILQ